MSSQYAGNPASFPSDYTIPDDGEAQDATSVNIAFEALGDRTAYLLSHLFKSSEALTILASGTVTAPANAVAAIVIACGGGGGGHGSLFVSSGGGGGGGAVKVVDVIPIVGGQDYAAVIGAGGTAGTANNNGGAGGDTTLTQVSTSSVVFTARGAGRGLGGQTTNADFCWGLGGTSVRAPQAGDTLQERPAQTCFKTVPTLSGSQALFTDQYRVLPMQHGANGFAIGSFDVSVRQYHFRGGASPQGFLGGRSGSSSGSSLSLYPGGGLGGGGGAGAFGDGGNGGNGGAGNDAGNGGNGTTAATTPAANGGGGGGGGGGAGAGSSPGGAGGRGPGGCCGAPDDFLASGRLSRPSSFARIATSPEHHVTPFADGGSRRLAGQACPARTIESAQLKKEGPHGRINSESHSSAA